jgi:adenylosuccinate synthase
VGEDIRKRGAEFGATTGRPRRCGWIDIVALKRAVRSTASPACASPSWTCSTACPR